MCRPGPQAHSPATGPQRGATYRGAPPAPSNVRNRYAPAPTTSAIGTGRGTAAPASHASPRGLAPTGIGAGRGLVRTPPMRGRIPPGRSKTGVSSPLPLPQRALGRAVPRGVPHRMPTTHTLRNPPLQGSPNTSTAAGILAGMSSSTSSAQTAAPRTAPAPRRIPQQPLPQRGQPPPPVRRAVGRPPIKPATVAGTGAGSTTTSAVAQRSHVFGASPALGPVAAPRRQIAPQPIPTRQPYKPVRLPGAASRHTVCGGV